MCDGTSLGANAGGVGRLALAPDSSGLLHAYFVANEAVYSCALPPAAPTFPPAPVLELPAGKEGGCLGGKYRYVDVVSDTSQAYGVALPGTLVEPCYGLVAPLGAPPYMLPSIVQQRS
jgi:hypothetical protein